MKRYARGYGPAPSVLFPESGSGRGGAGWMRLSALVRTGAGVGSATATGDKGSARLCSMLRKHHTVFYSHVVCTCSLCVCVIFFLN